MMDKKTKEKIIGAIKETVETVVFVVVMVVIIRFFIGEIRWIPSASMHPTLIEGDRIFVERFSRFYSEPKRGDIMVFLSSGRRDKNRPTVCYGKTDRIFSAKMLHT